MTSKGILMDGIEYLLPKELEGFRYGEPFQNPYKQDVIMHFTIHYISDGVLEFALNKDLEGLRPMPYSNKLIGEGVIEFSVVTPTSYYFMIKGPKLKLLSIVPWNY